MQKSPHIRGPADCIIELCAVNQLIFVEILQQLIREIFHESTSLRGSLFQGSLEFIADLIAVYRLITDNQANKVGGVGQFSSTGKVHRQIKAGIEKKRFQKNAGYLFG